MSNATQEYHLLHVRTPHGEQMYYLNAAAISIGRDSSNAVRVDDPLVSRHHAILLRVPSQTNQYAYQIVDGDIDGRPSKNGVFVNQSPHPEKLLATGDTIKLGSTELSYMIAHMTPEDYSLYFDAQPVKFHSLKEEILDPTGTLVTVLPSAA